MLAILRSPRQRGPPKIEQSAIATLRQKHLVFFSASVLCYNYNARKCQVW